MKNENKDTKKKDDHRLNWDKIKEKKNGWRKKALDMRPEQEKKKERTKKNDMRKKIKCKFCDMTRLSCYVINPFTLVIFRI